MLMLHDSPQQGLGRLSLSLVSNHVGRQTRCRPFRNTKVCAEAYDYARHGRSGTILWAATAWLMIVLTFNMLPRHHDDLPASGCWTKHGMVEPAKPDSSTVRGLSKTLCFRLCRSTSYEMKRDACQQLGGKTRLYKLIPSTR